MVPSALLCLGAYDGPVPYIRSVKFHCLVKCLSYAVNKQYIAFLVPVGVIHVCRVNGKKE